MVYELSDELFTRDVIIGTDIVLYEDLPYDVSERVGPMFNNVAAMILHEWSLDSTQDETSGDAQYGNGWHALFRSERAILQAVSSGACYAWRVPDNANLDAEWERIEAGAVYPDDIECEGHQDTDDALLSGAGIGESVYCDGSCR